MIMRSPQNSFKQTFDNSLLAMLMINPGLEFVLAGNNAAARMLGQSIQGLKQRVLSDIVCISEIQKQNIHLSRLLEQKQAYKTNFCFSKKLCAFCTITPVCAKDKQLLAYLLVIETLNICSQEHICSERDAQEQKIKQLLFNAESKLKAIFNSAQDCIFIKDAKLRYIDVNFCMEQKFDMSLSAIIGKTDADIFGQTAVGQMEQADQQVLEGQTISLEYTKTVNNILCTFHVVKSPIRDDQDNIIGLCGIARDITARKQTEEALKKYEIQLETQNKVLITKNMALKELISQIEQEKNKIKQDIVDHIEHEIMPLLSKTALKGRTGQYLTLIRKHLMEINSSLLSAQQDYNFTPREAEISRFIRDGLTSKEIGQLLKITSQTIDKHRQNIRKKMGLTDQTVNLTSYLTKH